MRKLSLVAGVAALAVTAGTAQAHGLGANGAGFAAGFAHPLSGLDHLLAMGAVGLWAAQLGGRALWQVPLAFLAMMAVGSLAGFAGTPIPAVEVGIVGSLLVLGVLVAAAARLPVAVGATLVGLFALFHGHAHGTEMPQATSAVLYGLGFVLATAFLHAAGLALGMVGANGIGRWAVRLGGAGVAAAGLLLLVV